MKFADAAFIVLVTISAIVGLSVMINAIFAILTGKFDGCI